MDEPWYAVILAVGNNCFCQRLLGGRPTPFFAAPPAKIAAMLFTPHHLGALTPPNRIVMPPMTRSRSSAGNVPTAEMATYYAQRASAGLIVSEGTQISPQGQGCLDPGHP